MAGGYCEIEASLKTLRRRELQSLAKHCGVRANSKSSEIVAQMLNYCRNKLRTAPLFRQLLSDDTQTTPNDTEDAQQRPSLVLFENQAFKDEVTDHTLLEGDGDQDMDRGDDVEMEEEVKMETVSEEVAKAYRDGKEKGMWFGRMYQKLEDLEMQWKRYLDTSDRTEKRERSTRRKLYGNKATLATPYKLKGHTVGKKKQTRSKIKKGLRPCVSHRSNRKPSTKREAKDERNHD